MSAIKPNFFLVGAPKCGTTSLYSYLSDHPNVHDVYIKEPSYFATDMPNAQLIKNLGDYNKLYLNSANKLCGDYSTSYFHSSVAINQIMRFNPDAKIIISLRNPVDCMYSLFNQQRYSLNEVEIDFKRAWEAGDDRLKDKLYKASRRNPIATIYKEAGKLGEYTQKIQNLVPPHQLHIILFDDLKLDTQKVYSSLLDFLGLENDGRNNFQVQASAAQYRSKIITHLLSSKGMTGSIKRNLKNLFGIEHSSVIKKIHKANKSTGNIQPLNDQMRRELSSYFDDEISLIENILRRNLSHWR